MRNAWIAGALMLWTAWALAGAEVCYYVSDTTSGKHRICTYKCPSGNASITISDTKRCPVNITR